MTWPIVYTPVTSLAGTEYFIGETAAGAGKAVPANLLAYKDASGIYQVAGDLKVADPSGDTIVQFGANGATPLIINALDSLVRVEFLSDHIIFARASNSTNHMQMTLTAITLYRDTTISANLTVTGNTILGNAGGDTITMTGSVTMTGAVTITNGLNISGGALTLATPLAVAQGGSGSTTAAAARTAFGLGTIATQNSNAVSISGGSISGISALSVSGTFGVTSAAGGAQVLIDFSATGANYFDATTNHNFRVYGGAQMATINATGVQSNGSVKPASYTVAGVPSAATHGAGATIYVSNETGGAVIAFSDGTNWRRVTDRAIVA